VPGFGMSVSGTASGSGVVPASELLLLLLESSPGSLGAGAVGKGCSSAAEVGFVVGLGESGGGVVEVEGFAGLPGKGNCSEAEGFFAGEHGAAGWDVLWPGAGHGAGEFCAGVVCAWQAAEKRSAASDVRIFGPVAIAFRVLVRYLDGVARWFVIVSSPGLFPCLYFI
jgi:hypothetical protein